MNPRELEYVLLVMRGKSVSHMPWVGGGPSAKRIALAKDQGGKRDWFPVSPALYETIENLDAKLRECTLKLLDLRIACL